MSLSENSMLVKVSLSVPGNSRKDKAITAATIRQNSLGEGAGKWLKQLFPDEALEPLTELQSEIRGWHYERTLPWTDEGYRILPTAMHGEYVEAMRAFRVKFESAAAAFLDKLPEWESWARQQHNGTFDGRHYDRRKLGKKFSMATDFLPVPTGGDFRVAVDADTRQAVDARVKAAEEFAAADLWRRLAEPLAHIVERCGQPDKVFRDSLVGNLRQIASLIPKLNLSADARLADFAAQAAALAAVAPGDLRKDLDTRKATADKAAAILQRMADFMPAQPEENGQ